MSVCYGCKHKREIVQVDDLGRGFCDTCKPVMPWAPELLGQAMLDVSVPYKTGDKVACRTGDTYDGVGHVIKVSFDIADGGSPVYPMFQIAFDAKEREDDPDFGWYPELLLSPVEVTA